MKRLASLAVASTILSLSGIASAASPDPNDAPAVESAPKTTDPLLPGGGSFAVAGASGIPFLALGELTYGFTDRFALGAIAAATPNVGSNRGTSALGLRPRGVLFASGPWRSVLSVPVLYYPEVEGFGGAREPWMLARPTVSVERALPGGASVSLSLGAIGVTCAESLLTLGKEHTMMGGIWETAGIGGTIPLSGRWTLFGEASLIARGIEPARDWLGGLPVVAFLGVATRL
jgi:hypothetical protein